MQTVTLELPDTSAKRINNLSENDKAELSLQIENWLNAKRLEGNAEILKAMQTIQNEVSALNLSKAEIEDLINESMT